jgi:hypothetical protein
MSCFVSCSSSLRTSSSESTVRGILSRQRGGAKRVNLDADGSALL